MADPPPPYSYQPGPPQYAQQPHAYPQAYQQPPPPLVAAPPPANYGATYNYPPPPPGRVVQQPVAVVARPYQVKPENYLVLSIVTMLFCCFICGLIALIYSLQVDSAYSEGDYEGARRAARIAKNLNIAAVVSGVAVGVISGVFVVIVYFVAIAVASSNPQ